MRGKRKIMESENIEQHYKNAIQFIASNRMNTIKGYIPHELIYIRDDFLDIPSPEKIL